MNGQRFTMLSSGTTRPMPPGVSGESSEPSGSRDALPAVGSMFSRAGVVQRQS